MLMGFRYGEKIWPNFPIRPHKDNGIPRIDRILKIEYLKTFLLGKKDYLLLRNVLIVNSMFFLK